MKWWNEMQNRHVTLAKRPIGIPTVNDFGLIETEIPELEAHGSRRISCFRPLLEKAEA
jgi:NADPH-dependent curcumin reductase CurA